MARARKSPIYFQPSTATSSDSGYASHATSNATSVVESLKSVRDSTKVPPTAPTAVPTGKAIEISKSASKSALGRVTIQIKDKPEICVVGVVVQSLSKDEDEVAPTWKPIKSQKLRRKALRAFVEQNVPSVGSNFSMNTRIGPNVNHLIFPFSDLAHENEANGLLDGMTAEVNGITKTQKKNAGGESDPIRCQVQKGAITDQYWQSLDLLIRTLASDSDAVTRQEFYRHGGEYFDQIDVSMKGGDRSPTAVKASTYEVKLRTQISVGSAGDSGWVNLDFDLVPIIPRKPLSEVVIDLFGCIPFARNGALVLPNDSKKVNYLSMLKHKLRGLKVTCAYVPKGASPAEILNAKRISEGEGRSFEIKDIKFPGVHSRFTSKNEAYDVPDYFQNVILGGHRPLEYSEWPLAEDDTGAWIPLEMLHVASNQVFSHCGHLTQGLHDKLRGYLKEDGDLRIRKKALAFFNDPRHRNAGIDDCVVPWKNWNLGLDEMVFDANASFFPERKTIRSNKNKSLSHVALLWIRPRTRVGDFSTLHERLKEGLRAKNPGVSFHMCEEGVFDGSSKGSLIADIKKADPQVKLILAVSSEKLGTTSTRPVPLDINARTKQIFSRLRKICELEEGVMLVCQTEKSLVKLFEKRNDNKTYFPSGLRHQIDFMLGQQNFETVVLSTTSEKDSKGVMIMGAHITHRSIGSKYCPSIATVVASTEYEDALNFPGSARFQRSTSVIEGLAPESLKRHPNDSITDLEAMLVERFAAWSDESEPPTSILFYRDSMNFANPQALNECAIIKAAFTAHFGTDFPAPLVTYIIVNKNVPLCYPEDQTDASIPADSPKIIGDFVIERGVRKHRYYVLQNEGGFLVKDLREITLNLNDSNQLCPQTDRVAKVLPLTWARKLSKRVFEYVKMEQINALGVIQRPKKQDPEDLEEELRREGWMVKIVKDHFTELSGRTDRALPWKEELDGSMFFL